MNELHYRIFIEVEDGISDYSSATVAMFKYQPDAFEFAERQFDDYSKYYPKVTVTVYRDDKVVRELIKPRV